METELVLVGPLDWTLNALGVPQKFSRTVNQP
jgi:hypothetical protein